MCAVTDLMCSDHLYPLSTTNARSGHGKLSVVHLYFVFQCFIAHTSAGELHTTFPFIFLLHKNITLLPIPLASHHLLYFLLSIIPTVYFAWKS